MLSDLPENDAPAAARNLPGGVLVAAPKAPIIAPVDTPDSTDLDHGDDHIVVVYDNPVNTYDQVIDILQKATGCSLQEAMIETWEVDHLGKSVVHHDSVEECNRAASIIRTIGIHVEVMPD
ncbi:MAG TPA: ATP-dependent Clp protease adaptor ClpS [Chthonomonadales bacterium]|nr:ATP-dependent Clp protease adaptor ClpS [Chthonomonadales bacterium]